MRTHAIPLAFRMSHPNYHTKMLPQRVAIWQIERSLKPLNKKSILRAFFRKHFFLYPLSYFRRRPKPEISPQHQARLGLNCRNRSKEYEGDRYQKPLRDHIKIFMLSITKWPRRQQYQRKINRRRDTQHRKRQNHRRKPRSIVGKHR